MKALTWTLAASFVAFSGLQVQAASDPDASFYKHAAEGGIAEVELGTMAQQKSPNQSLKDFASMMVTDHTAANDKLKSIAAGKGIALPTTSSVGQMTTKGKLDVESGDTFDKAYITAMVKDHESAITLFQKEADSGQDPDAKAFAAATLPTIRTHLKKIRAIAAAQGMTVK